MCTEQQSLQEFRQVEQEISPGKDWTSVPRKLVDFSQRKRSVYIKPEFFKMKSPHHLLQSYLKSLIKIAKMYILSRSPMMHVYLKIENQCTRF